MTRRSRRMTRKTRGGGLFKKNANEEFGKELNRGAAAAAARRAANRSRAAAYRSKTNHATMSKVLKMNPLQVVARSKGTHSKVRNVFSGTVSTVNPLHGRK